MSFSAVCRWVRHLSADVGPVTSAPKSGRSKSASSSPMIIKKCLLVKSDARYTSQRIVDMVEFSKASALCFWQNILKLKKESARWAPHLLNVKQKGVPFKTTHKLLKSIQDDQKIFLN